MSENGLYKIQLLALSEGNHRFTFDLDDAFFASKEGDVFGGRVAVAIDVNRLGKHATLHFSLEGRVSVACDRCLEAVEVAVENEAELVVKFGDAYNDDDDELIIVPESEGALDTAWLLYEYTALAVPMQNFHAEGECNEAMMAQYNHYVVGNTDIDKQEKQEIDPRWAALKNISDNN